MKLLEDEGAVEEDTYFEDPKGVYREFKLTARGLSEVKRLIQDAEFCNIYKIVSEIKKKYSALPLRELVEFTHQEFPGYVRKRK